jgi:carboxyl-terminal processing protease
MSTNTRTAGILMVSFLVLFGCEQMFVGPEPANEPESNFEIFWQDFDRHYAQFTIRHIDWDSVYALYRPQITPATSDRELFAILSSIVYGINDMHVDLRTPLGDVYWKPMIPASYPSRRIINACKYVQCGASQNSLIEYRTCQDPGYGYLLIPTFSGQGEGLTLADERYFVIDNILAQWKNLKGIIIDVRSNGGGNIINAETVAGRFADQSRIYSFRRQKTGPGKDNFSEWKSSSVEPKGSYQFLKPVVVLTSRATSSAAEMFVMAMQVLPNVTIVGDTTGGGVGNSLYRELPNGWTFRMSTEMEADASGRIMEGVGVFPDILVQTTVADSANGIDRILERGIDLLRNAR